MTTSLQWKPGLTVDHLNQLERKTIHDALGIYFTRLGADGLEAKMPIDERTHQIAGLLHGGASAVLAESLGSVAAWCVHQPSFAPVESVLGVELHISHLGSASEGWVLGRATPLHLGQRIHRWQIDLSWEGSSPKLLSRAVLAVSVKRLKTSL